MINFCPSSIEEAERPFRFIMRWTASRVSIPSFLKSDAIDQSVSPDEATTDLSTAEASGIDSGSANERNKLKPANKTKKEKRKNRTLAALKERAAVDGREPSPAACRLRLCTELLVEFITHT